MKTGFLIIGRLKSTRLPQKLMLEIEGRPVISHMIDRLRLCRTVDEIVLCTSTNPQDDPLEILAKKEKISVFRGHEDDVIQRLYDASTAFNLDYIVHITADCPFVDPVYVDKVVEAYKENNADLIRTLDLPHGAFCYGIKPNALKKVIEIKDKTDTEVWGRYFTDTGLFDVFDLPITNPRHCKNELRMTLDYPEDYEFFKRVFAALHNPGRVFSLDEILDYLELNPEVVAVNEHAEEKYKIRMTGQSGIKLKKQMQVKTAAIFGCGSIGQRHIKNLQELGLNEIYAFRTRKGHFQDLDHGLNVREVDSFEGLLNCRPDIAVIANPTSLHVETAKKIVPHIQGVYIEKPLSHAMDGIEELLEKIEHYNVTSFVGFNLRFHPVIIKCQDLIANHNFSDPIVFQCQVGQYLPNWHPYEDYRNAYYARTDLGGGVTLTMIHELDLAIGFFGEIETISCFSNQYKAHQIDVESVSDMMIRHKTGAVSQIHLDYVQKPTNRCGIISFEEGWIKYDLIHPAISYFSSDMSEPQPFTDELMFDNNASYLAEMKCFIDFTEQKLVRHEHDVWSAIESQKVANAALKASQQSDVMQIN